MDVLDEQLGGCGFSEEMEIREGSSAVVLVVVLGFGETQEWERDL